MRSSADSGYWRPIASGGSLVVVAFILWLLLRGEHDEFATLSGHQKGVFSMALSPDRKLVASGGGDGTVRIWDVATLRQTQLFSGHKGEVGAVAWSPTGDFVVSAGDDRSVRIGRLGSGKDLEIFAEVPRVVNALAISSDGNVVAAAVDTQIYIWRFDNRRELRTLGGHTRPITGMVFLPNRLELVSFAGDKTVRFWDLTKYKQIALAPGPMGHCYGMSLSDDGKMIACVGGGRVHLYNADTRQALDPIEPNLHIICGATFSPDGQVMAIGTQDHQVILWDLPRKKQIVRLKGHAYAVGQMGFLNDGQTLITSSHDSTLKLWKVR